MVGTLWGTDSWFHPANGHWYGRSSGPVSEPYGDGLCFVNHVVIGETSPLIDEVAEYLRIYQEQPGPQ